MKTKVQGLLELYADTVVLWKKATTDHEAARGVERAAYAELTRANRLAGNLRDALGELLKGATLEPDDRERLREALAVEPF